MREIVQQGVDLLILCPPCNWAGGWFHLNKLYMNPKEVREKELLTKLFIRFCCEVLDLQLKMVVELCLNIPKGLLHGSFHVSKP